MHPLVARRGFPLVFSIAVWVLGAVGLLGYWAWTPGVLLEWCSPLIALFVAVPLGGGALAIIAAVRQSSSPGYRALSVVLATLVAIGLCWLLYWMFFLVVFLLTFQPQL